MAWESAEDYHANMHDFECNRFTAQQAQDILKTIREYADYQLRLMKQDKEKTILDA